MGENDQYRESILLGKYSDDDDDERCGPDPYGYYAALGVSQSASQNAIRQAFLHLSATYHTDKHVGESKEIQQLMNERFQKLQEAYKVLSDEKQRVAYDAVGKKGLDYLALVPQGVNRHEDIARYLSTLEREADLLRLAKTLSNTSAITLSYNMAQFFLSSNESSTIKPEEEKTSGNLETSTVKEPEKWAGVGEGKGEGAVVEGDESNTLNAETSSLPSLGDVSSTVEEGPTKVSARVSARVVMLDGRKQIVLIPSPNIEKVLRQHMGFSDSIDLNQSSSRDVSKFYRLLNKIHISAIPTRIAFRHTFWHSVTPSLGVTVRTVARHEGSNTYVGCAGVSLYAPNNVVSYSASCRVTLKGVRVTLSHIRQLNVLWTLHAKLLCFNALQLLQRYELVLERKLSSVWSLRNALVMSIVDFGSFRTSLLGLAPNGMQRSVSAFFGYNKMDIHLFNLSPTVYGDVEEEKEEKERQKRDRGHVSQSIFLSVFGGYGRIGFEAVHNLSKRQKIGIGFHTTLPQLVQFFIYNPHDRKKSSVNTFTVIYQRGENRIEIPVVAFISSKFQQAILWLTAPVILYRIARLIWRPIQRSRTASLYRHRRLQHQTEMDLERVRAIREQKGLESSALRNRLMEERVGGLIIINAKYGVLNPYYTESLCSLRRNRTSSDVMKQLPWWRRWGGWKCTSSSNATVVNSDNIINNAEEDEMYSSILQLDVTIPLQHLVRNSQLILPAGSKSKLVGFTNPDPFTSEKKELRIIYWFQHRRHMLTVKDSDPVELPRREHLVST